MDVKQLRYFISVARRGGVGAAAREHFVTQPAVSIQLKRLEEELGEKLIARRGGKTAVTSTGKAFLRMAEDVVERISLLEYYARDVRECRRGLLDMGCIDAAGIYVLPHVFRKFRKRFPGVDINVEVSDSSRLINDLDIGRIEMAVVTLPIMKEGFEVLPIYKERMILVVHPGHSLAKLKGPILKAVAESGLITYPSGSTTRKIIEDVFSSRGLVLRTAMEVSSPEAIKKLTEAGLGASVLPSPIVRAELKKGLLKELPLGRAKFHRGMGLVFQKRELLSPPAREFVIMLLEAVR